MDIKQVLMAIKHVFQNLGSREREEMKEDLVLIIWGIILRPLSLHSIAQYSSLINRSVARGRWSE